MKKYFAASSLLVIAACQPQEPAEAPVVAAEPPPAAAPAPAPAPVAAAPAPAPAPPPELSAEQKAARYQACWQMAEKRDYAALAGCYTDDAMGVQVDSGMQPATGGPAIVEQSAKTFNAAFPDAKGQLQLTLVNGNMVVGIASVRGTHTAPLMGPGGALPPTNKKVGYLMGHVVEMSGNQAAREWTYADAATMMGQLGVVKLPVRKAITEAPSENEVVIASGDCSEQVNIDIYKKAVAAYNKHDGEALAEFMTEDVELAAQYLPKDVKGKRAVLRTHAESWKAMSNAKLTDTAVWAAGDYVVAVGYFEGTNDGPYPTVGLWKKTDKSVKVQTLEIVQFDNYRVSKQWIFSNGMAFATQLGLVEGPAKPAPAKPAAAQPAAAQPAAAQPAAAQPAAAQPAAAPAAKPAQ